MSKIAQPWQVVIKSNLKVDLTEPLKFNKKSAGTWILGPRKQIWDKCLQKFFERYGSVDSENA